jgi:hypothetical protein
MRLDGSETGFLNPDDKHGQARGEHGHRGDGHGGPPLAGTRLLLHEFFVRSDD